MARPTARVERSSDRWASIALSVLLHGGLVAAFAYGWWTYKRDRPQPTLAIEASVVDARTVPGLNRLQPTPNPTPPPPAPPPPENPPPPQESEGPPPPTPDELAKREQEQKAEADREAQAKQQAEDQKRQEQERQQEQALAEEKAAQQKRDEEQRQAEEQKKAQEKAEADRKAKEAADAKKKADEQKRLEAEKKAQAEADAQRQAELQQSLSQEMQRDSARTSTAVTTWVGQITRKIQDSWRRPSSATQGIVCELTVTQVPGGEVTNARVGSCNGDALVKQSIVDAAYRASPLPPPPDPSLFERTLIITFRPD